VLSILLLSCTSLSHKPLRSEATCSGTLHSHTQAQQWILLNTDSLSEWEATLNFDCAVERAYRASVAFADFLS
jgi:hypothetical protein